MSFADKSGREIIILMIRGIPPIMDHIMATGPNGVDSRILLFKL
jgi:hypothetical protein